MENTMLRAGLYSSQFGFWGLRDTGPDTAAGSNKGKERYLYRTVDSRGQTIDFLLAARRDADAAKRFFHKVFAAQ
jgi:hypothetical protein